MMDKRELSRDERWEILNKISKLEQVIIPWDRMVLPPQEWMDSVDTLGYNDPTTLKSHKGKTINIPRYWDELTEEMKEYLNIFNSYKN